MKACPCKRFFKFDILSKPLGTVVKNGKQPHFQVEGGMAVQFLKCLTWEAIKKCHLTMLCTQSIVLIVHFQSP